MYNEVENSNDPKSLSRSSQTQARDGNLMDQNVDLTSDASNRYRALIANIDFSDSEKDEIIGVVTCIMQAHIDLYFRDDAAQLSLKAGHSDSFLRDSFHGNMRDTRDDSQKALENKGARRLQPPGLEP